MMLLNINALQNKFQNITFILDEALADVFVIQEPRLGPKNCDSDFTHKNYNMFRRDRPETYETTKSKNHKKINGDNKNNKKRNEMESKGGGLILYIKKPYTPFDINIDETLEGINFTI